MPITNGFTYTAVQARTSRTAANTLPSEDIAEVQQQIRMAAMRGDSYTTVISTWNTIQRIELRRLLTEAEYMVEECTDPADHTTTITISW